MNLRPPGILLRLGPADSVCWRCSLRLSRPHDAQPTIAARTFGRSFSRGFSRSRVAPNSVAWRADRLKTGYFFANSLSSHAPQDSGSGRTGAPTTTTTTATDGPQNSAPASPAALHPNHDLPHRRHQAARRQAAAAAAAAAAADSSPLPAEDASSALTTAAAKSSASSVRRHLSLYLSLSKPRLTVLVVLSAMSSYALYPVPDFLSPTAGVDAPSLSPLTLSFLTVGTALCSASANALNMLYEPKTDAKMSRTRNRPLVRGLLSQRSAVGFAILAALTGVGALYYGVNPTVAFLGATNIFLYAGVYTPMKRLHWFNTWVGAIVGGIPPLMGWAAAAGESATGTGSFQELLLTADAAGGWLLAALLFAWQFPHFMALSWSIREEYKAAGLKMLSWVNPARNGRVALRYSLAFFPICFGLAAVGVTDWSYAVTSLPINVWLTREAFRFWQHEGAQGSARGLFWASVWHLPVVMILALVQKKGMWGRVWRAVFGEPDFDDEEWDDEEIFEPVAVVADTRAHGGSQE